MIKKAYDSKSLTFDKKADGNKSWTFDEKAYDSGNKKAYDSKSDF